MQMSGSLFVDLRRQAYTSSCLVLMVVVGIVLAAGCTKPEAKKTKPESATAAKTPEKADSPAASNATDGKSVAETPKAEAPAKAEETPKTENPPAPATDSTTETPDSSASADVAASPIVLGGPELTAGIPGEGPLTVEQITAWLDDPKNHETLEVELPLGLSLGQLQIVGLKENPLTRAKIELGRQLYFDPRLSADTTISCATCHNPDTGFAAPTQFGEGILGQKGNRNSPTAYNRILSGAQFWDGRAGSLEDQAVGPIANPIEMGHTHEACVKCLEEIQGYKLQFAKVFGELTIDSVGKAIASFERVIVTGPSAYDYHTALEKYTRLPAEDLELLEEDDPKAFAEYKRLAAEAEKNPMSESAVRGKTLFFSDKSRCATCHVGANFTDEKYHNLGVGMEANEPDLGRFTVSDDEKDRGAFKTPTLRNVVQTSPYMHDGSQKTLEEVVEWYAKGGHPNPHLSDKVVKLDLSEQDKKDLVEFMRALTGTLTPVARGRLPE
jgi:cytochrome c peroxidase